MVPRQHLCHELFDAGRGGTGGEAFEQSRPDAAPVQVVGDGERDLGPARIVQPNVRRERDRADRASAAGELAEERAAS